MKKLGTFLIGLALLTGCGNGRPNDIIQPEQMEEILYDYHLSIGMSTHLRSNENYHREASKRYIFDKHAVTEAEFDSAMVWYTRNAQDLADIYARLETRFEREHTLAETLMESREEKKRSFISGDTVDVWTNRDIYWLTKSPMSNQLLFDIFPDTTFHEKDAFLWSIDYHFLQEGPVTMGFNIIYDNDSVVGETRLITESGKHTMYLHSDSAYQIKSLNGFVYLMKDSVQQPNVLLHNISLMRYHAVNDSLSVAETVTEEEAPAMPAEKEPSTSTSKKDFKKSFDRKKREMENVQRIQ